MLHNMSVQNLLAPAKCARFFCGAQKEPKSHLSLSVFLLESIYLPKALFAFFFLSIHSLAQIFFSAFISLILLRI